MSDKVVSRMTIGYTKEDGEDAEDKDEDEKEDGKRMKMKSEPESSQRHRMPVSIIVYVITPRGGDGLICRHLLKDERSLQISGLPLHRIQFVKGCLHLVNVTSSTDGKYIANECINSSS